MRIKTRTHTVHSVEIEGAEVELTFAPCSEYPILAERVGKQLVVAYLVRDDDCPSNPMEDGDAQGHIYTRGERNIISDNEGELYSALGLDSYGGVDIDKDFLRGEYAERNGKSIRQGSLRDIAAKQHLETVRGDYDGIQKWLEERDLELVEGEDLVDAFNERRNDIWKDLEDHNGVFCDEVESLAIGLYPQYWQQIAGPFVVPMSYSGYYDTSIDPTEWDGDPDDLPNCVWVADKGAEENIRSSCLPGCANIHWAGAAGSKTDPLHAVVTLDGLEVFDAGTESNSWGRALKFVTDAYGPPDDADLRRTVKEYAESVCSEYAKWCSGEVFGCVTEIFDLISTEGDEVEWEKRGDEDACWGFIGEDYAMETLKSEYLESPVEKLKGEKSC